MMISAARKAKLQREFRKFRLRYIDRGRLRRLHDYMVVETSSVCTLRCSVCPHGCDPENIREGSIMTLADFEKIEPNLDIIATNIFLHLHGEPLLNKDLPEITRRLAAKGGHRFTLFSNATRINPEILDRLLGENPGLEWEIGFSAEIHSDELYAKTRVGGTLDEFKTTLDMIDEIMSRHGVDYSVNAIISSGSLEDAKRNIKQVFGRYNRLKQIGFSNRFPWPHLPATGDLAGNLIGKKKRCSQLYDTPVVMANGDVSLCTNDYRGEHVIGNLKNTSFRKLLNCRKAREFRLNLVNHHQERNTLCAECLLPRFQPFQRTMKRQFALDSPQEWIDKYFDSFKKFLNHGEE